MADFKRKPGESFESFLRKFKRGLKNNKRLEKARANQHYSHKKTKRQQKIYALKSLQLRAKNEYLRKTGKLPESNIQR